MGHVLGGLLQGLGSGLSQNAAQIREDSLMAARRKWQLQDQQTKNDQQIAAEGRLVERNIATEDRKETRTIAAEDRKFLRDVGVLELSHEHQRRRDETLQQYKERLVKIKHGNAKELVTQKANETRKTQAQKAGFDRSLESFKFKNQKERDRILNDFENDKIDNVKAAEDGTMIVTYKDGTVTRQSDVKLRQSSPLGGGLLGAVDAAGNDKKPQASVTRPSDKPEQPPEKTPEGIAAANKSLDAMMASGELGPGENVGDTMQVPAGAIAATGIQIEWDGKRWVYSPRVL